MVLIADRIDDAMTTRDRLYPASKQTGLKINKSETHDN